MDREAWWTPLSTESDMTEETYHACPIHFPFVGLFLFLSL